MTTDFGLALKEWRGKRKMSQLDMALKTEVSARHISFLETGRAQPSRGMVLRLSETLGLPRPARNHLLTAAGLAPAYAARAREAPDLSPLNDAIHRMLDTHDPYPGFVLDHDWTAVTLNQPAQRLFGAVDVAAGDNLLDALCDNAALRDAIVNLDEVIAYTITRLRTEATHFGGDSKRVAAIRKLIDACPHHASLFSGVYPAIIPARYRTPLGTLSLFTTIAQFGSVEDIAFAELKVELMFPADAASREMLDAMA